MNIADSMIDLVGKTPLVRLNRVSENVEAEVIGKLESMNPCFSVKDRIGFNMVQTAIDSGKTNEETVFVEATSGNTGIGIAFTCAVKGFPLILTMPESMSQERRALLKGFGAQLILTPAAKGMAGAVEEANRITEENPNAIHLQQFANEANPAIHRKTTAKEILADTDGTIDIFVAGVGTGGTITGVGSVLKQHNKEIKCVAVEPDASPVLSGGEAGPHAIQGIGAGFIPEVLDRNVIDEIIRVTNEDALAMARRLMKEEGIMCGISSGANAYAALQLAKRPENKGKRIVFIICDTAERYLSTPLFTEAD
ncbi:cysteine synthase A [Halodesulfovibrio marinisediminis]|uniref:Cysteine synthase n=1 Tax=Halodesulfovibrio marinisediminis DSM 17456 TaxID=1121457 RepID=A0A1N6FWT0_9BACT|nr:cysteine synthase A [Halodesulfovibrio marinisediminis]SIN99703.1 cysteine synthase A [Halodesulfovibrio marinisediminis DSM 17456]